MADIGDDDEFFDDELDGLGSDDFLALEDQAIESANQARGLSVLQQPSEAQEKAPNREPVAAASNGFHNAFEEEEVEDEAHQLVIPDITARHLYKSTSNALQAGAPSESTQREQWRQNRFAAPEQEYLRGVSESNLTLPHRAVDINAPYSLNTTQPHQSSKPQGQGSEIEQLRVELNKLRLEKQGLQEAVKAANDQVLAKTGEISIIRSNQAKTAHDYEKRIREIQTQHLLQNEKHHAEIEQARKEREKLATHNQFLNHEMNDENWQLKRARKTLKGKETGTNNERKIYTTPKKTRKAPFGDGFEDDEVMIVSPSKAASKSKVTTPRGGTKRKRDALGESPVRPLELNSAGASFALDDEPLSGPVESFKHVFDSGKDDNRFEFLRLILDRRLVRNERRTFEVLTDFRFPSDPTSTLSGLLMDKMAPLSSKQNIKDFPSTVGQIILSLWSRCLQESYHSPLRYLLDLVKFILFEGSTDVASSLMDTLVDLAQRTADINIIPRYKRFKRKTGNDETENRPIDPDIDTQEYLQLLELIAILCNRDPDLVKRFWRSMRFDFISMLLRNSQDLDDITLMVKLLARSVRIDSFAMIVAPPASQSASESHVIDRLSSMLIEVPRTVEGERSYTAAEIAMMRLEILTLIETMFSKPYCGSAFARHPSALARLVRVMHDELNALYEWQAGHEERAELINGATRLLFHITTAYKDGIGNLQDKLRAPPTAAYKHLIVLSRLAFSEGLFFERDIEEDVVDAAHQMLEELVTPEEGEALEKAFVGERRGN